MENRAKKEWQAPVVETLVMSQTMAGKGTSYIDFVSVSDLDIGDEPTDRPVPVS
ncbi:paeninodin family lasso peptide [Paenibacillus turpanensis]|uniref:paeninodin family lasso peptide n=1 Tax=Paenibacillus turpanensis TaxID=2689078 RepID=UPI00140E637E|nr:paeninodin family lasso peptide [Paenibacillus turpanensis]